MWWQLNKCSFDLLVNGCLPFRSWSWAVVSRNNKNMDTADERRFPFRVPQCCLTKRVEKLNNLFFFCGAPAQVTLTPESLSFHLLQESSVERKPNEGHTTDLTCWIRAKLGERGLVISDVDFMKLSCED